MIQRNEAELAQLLQNAQANHDTTQNALFSVYQKLELDSRVTYPNSPDRLVKAILAGDRLVAAAAAAGSKEGFLAVLPSLIDLLARRSRWHLVDRWPDFERALQFAEQWRDLEEDKALRISSLQKLAQLYEELYDRNGKYQDLKQAIRYTETASLHANGIAREALIADAACLRFKIDTMALPCVLNIPIDELRKQPVSYAKATRKRFRFIDARSLAAGEGLRVLELPALPKQRYVPLSYVWRGSHDPTSEEPSMGTMSVEGAVGADPISIDVLMIVAKCVAKFNCELLWLDGVCIIQNDPEDKGWQIQNMFDVYMHCKACLIIPGGLSRLVPLTEPTSWIHRAWTLQEAFVPKTCAVLFSWTLGTCVLQKNFPVAIDEVESGKAAHADLHGLLMMALSPAKHAHILGPPNYSHANALGGTSVGLFGEASEVANCVALLGALDHRGKEGMRNALWRSALMRVALRPADTIFSIMGIMGVTLNPLDYDASDRTGPTIALMQAMLQKGERAEWLGAAPSVSPNPEVPTFPQFPKTNAQGRAVIETGEGEILMSQAMRDSWWKLQGAPKGYMRADGTLVLHAPTIPIRREVVGEDTKIQFEPTVGSNKPASDWWVQPQETGPPFAVQIGEKLRYTNGAVGTMVDPKPFLLMLVEQVSRGHLREIGYATTSKALVDMDGWSTQELAVAGGQV